MIWTNLFAYLTLGQLALTLAVPAPTSTDPNFNLIRRQDKAPSQDPNPSPSPSPSAAASKAASPSSHQSQDASQSSEPTSTKASASGKPSHSASKSQSGSESKSDSSSSAKATQTTIVTNGTISDGSSIPEACAQMCANAYWKIDECQDGSRDCTDVCGWITYTNTVECLNCLVAYDTPKVDAKKAQTMIHSINELCQDAGKAVQSYGRITAKPTQTGPMTKLDTGIAETTTSATRYVFLPSSTGAGERLLVDSRTVSMVTLAGGVLLLSIL